MRLIFRLVLEGEGSSDDAIYIKGTKGTLLRTLVALKGGKSAGIGVPGFVPKWRKG